MNTERRDNENIYEKQTGGAEKTERNPAGGAGRCAGGIETDNWFSGKWAV